MKREREGERERERMGEKKERLEAINLKRRYIRDTEIKTKTKHTHTQQTYTHPLTININSLKGDNSIGKIEKNKQPNRQPHQTGPTALV